MLKALVRATGADRLGEDRVAWIAVFALCAIYVAGFLAFYPRTFTNTDEAMYVRQARAFLAGKTTYPKVDPFTDEVILERPSDYPVGTALYIAPFVAVGGPEAAFLAPCVALIAAVLLTACWLREDRRSPVFALLLLGFLPAMVLGRVPLSSLPSVALVALGMWLFWRGADRQWTWWLASGFLAGASLCFRESNVLPFAPFFAGAVLRGEKKWWALLVGGLLGVGMRLLSAYVVYGDPLFVKQGYYFRPDTIMERVPYYAFGLLVLLPGGLVAGLAYRGRRWPELVASVVIFTVFYLTQKHTTSPSGPGRALVIALRYFIPLIPVLVFAMAEVFPRAWRALCERMGPERRASMQTLASATVALWMVGIAGAALAVHVLSYAWSASQVEIRDAIRDHVGDESVIITNWQSTRKFLRRLDRRYVPVDRSDLDNEDVASLVDRHGDVYVVLLDRSDTEFWIHDAEENAEFVAGLEIPHLLEVDREVTPTDRLRIWRVSRDLARSPGGGDPLRAAEGTPGV